MKRSTRISAILLSILMLLSVASCGSGSISSGQTSFGPGSSTSGGDAPEVPNGTTGGDRTPEDDATTNDEGASEPDAATTDDVTIELDGTTSGDGTSESNTEASSDVTTEISVTTDDDGTSEADVTTDGDIAPEPTPELGSDVGDLCHIRELSLIGGGTVNIEELRGKVILLNFWGAWCPPCREELLHEFPSVYEAYGNDVIVLTVHSVYNYDTSAVSSFLSGGGVTSFPTFLFAVDSGNEAYYTQLGGTGYWPYTLILDENGVIAAKFFGAVTFDRHLKSILDALTND